MSLGVVLDAGPLGLLCHRKGVARRMNASAGSACICRRDTSFFIPEIADYEVRRELLRLNKTTGVRRLDYLHDTTEDTYLPLTSMAMLRAAELWAESRKLGHPTADPKELDADVILAAQIQTAEFAQTEVVVATTNVGHLSSFVTGMRWQDV